MLKGAYTYRRLTTKKVVPAVLVDGLIGFEGTICGRRKDQAGAKLMFEGWGR